MKDQTVASLLESGEIFETDDVIFMLDTIGSLFERGMVGNESFIGYGIHLMDVWRESLADSSADTDLADEVIANIVMGKQ